MASFFVRTQNAFASNFEIGLAALETRCRDGLARNSVREMDAALEEARRERFAADERRDGAAADEKRLRAEIADWRDKAAFALGKDRADLAELALAAELDAEAKLAEAGKAKAAAAKDAQRIQALMDEMLAQRQDMAARARTLDSRPAGRGSGSRLTPEQRAEVARARFERIVEDLDGAAPPPAAESQGAADLDQLRRSDEIERRLAELKSAAGKTGRTAGKKG